MGAYVPWVVTVLRVIEDEVIVDAVSSSDALDAASKEPGVVQALRVRDYWEDDK